LARRDRNRDFAKVFKSSSGLRSKVFPPQGTPASTFDLWEKIKAHERIIPFVEALTRVARRRSTERWIQVPRDRGRSCSDRFGHDHRNLDAVR
jgi:hypothetical protein